MLNENNEGTVNNIIWFRHGLRLHDNPSLLESLKNDYGEQDKHIRLFPVFIFDGESAGTKLVGYNRMRFLIESLRDLDRQFRRFGGQLLIFHGNPTTIFRRLFEEFNINKLCFEEDCEPIWKERDDNVVNLCQNNAVRCVVKVSHTLWDPKEVIRTNGGIPPLTYQMFLHTVNIVGPPPKPVSDPNFESMDFGTLSKDLATQLNLLSKIPTPEDFGIFPDGNAISAFQKWVGGEKNALESLKLRLDLEKDAFRKGQYLPTQAKIDLLGPPTSMSAALRFGCLSVRKFYWNVHDLYSEVQSKSICQFPSGPHITGQFIWREYFYTMSVTNPYYAEMKANPICLDIPWYEPKDDSLEKWKTGKTGYPLIDASMRQLLAEGWLHHILRNTVATFLTRGALWISWEAGVQHFLKYLLDADWSVCAGNWMWVSSSAFEKLLDSSTCTSPVALSRRLDPKGDYIKRYVPELKNMPAEFIHEPWKAPDNVQGDNECVIGVHYPEPMIDLAYVTHRNTKAMQSIRDSLISQGTTPPHCRPSNVDEVRQFFWMPDNVAVEG